MFHNLIGQTDLYETEKRPNWNTVVHFKNIKYTHFPNTFEYEKTLQNVKRPHSNTYNANKTLFLLHFACLHYIQNNKRIEDNNFFLTGSKT